MHVHNHITTGTNYHKASKKIIRNIVFCLQTHPVTKIDELQLNTSDMSIQTKLSSVKENLKKKERKLLLRQTVRSVLPLFLVVIVILVVYRIVNL